MWIEFFSYMKAIQGTVDNLKGKSIQYRMSKIYTTSEIAIICSLMYSLDFFFECTTDIVSKLGLCHINL